MPDTLTIPQHDQRPAVEVELKDGDGFAVVLAATDTAYWLMRPVTDLTHPLRVAVDIVEYGVASTGPEDPGTPARVRWEPDDTGAPTEWGSSGHTTGAVGIYDQETEVVDEDGLPMTFPTDLPNTITIRDDVDYP